MNSSEKIAYLRNQHKKWRAYNFQNKEGFFPIFSDFKLELKYLSPGAVTLFIYLGLHSNNITGECMHSLELIAKNLNKSTRTISNWMKELEERELVTRIQPNFNSSSKTFIMPYTDRFVKEQIATKKNL